MKTELEVITKLAQLEKEHINLVEQKSSCENPLDEETWDYHININAIRIEALEWVLNPSINESNIKARSFK
jgi:hypothetical protein